MFRHLLILSIFLVSGVLSIHEDEAGKFDWYKEKIGEPEQIAIPAHPRLVKKKLFYVSTAQSTIAALNIRTGITHWRRVLPKHEKVNSMRLYDKTLVTLSGDRFLQAWDAEEGILLWSTYLEASADITFKGFLASKDNTATIVGIQVPQTYQQPSDAVEAKTPLLHLYPFDVTDGVLGAPEALPIPAGSWNGMQPYHLDWRREKYVMQLTQMSNNGLLLINPAQSAATYYDGATGLFQDTSLKAHVPAEAAAAPDAWKLGHARGYCSHVLLQVSTSSALVLDISGGSPSVQHLLPLQPGVSLSVCGASLETDEVLVLRTQAAEKTSSVQLFALSPSASPSKAVDFSTLTPQYIDQQLQAGASAVGAVRFAALQSFQANSEGKLGYRGIVVTEDATVTMVQGDRSPWHRVEGLALVQDCIFVNLPKASSEGDDGPDSVPARIAKRLASQVTQFQERMASFGGWLAAETIYRLKGEAPPAEEDEDAEGQDLVMTQDRFGFQKLILAHTTSSVYALHTAKGRIAWKRFLKYDALSLLLKGKPQDVETYTKFAERCQVTITSTYNLDEKMGTHVKHEYLAVVAVSVYPGPRHAMAWTAPTEQHTIVLKLGVTQGAILDAAVYPARMVHTMLLPYHFKAGDPANPVDSRPLLLMDADLKAHLYPDAEAVKHVIAEHASHVFFYITDISEGRVTGYGLTQQGRKASELWRIAVDMERGEEVTAVSYTGMDRGNFVLNNAIKLFTNATKSGDPEFGFKYTNPNIFAVATTLPASTHHDNQGNVKGKVGPSINLYLVDGVTGSIISQMNHPNAAAPVTMLNVENFLIYHYLNVKHMKYQLGVWELFEDSGEPTGGSAVVQGMVQSVMGSAPQPRSAFTIPPPLISRHMFTYPTALDCLSTSVSTKGITTKLILAGNSLGQVVGMLLPSLENTKVNTITHPAQSILSYNKTIHHLRRIRASPSYLESTSHFIAVGLDLFYTRTSPAKSYDLLGDDFSYWLLLTTTTGLFVATIVAKAFAKRSALSLAWS